MALPQLQIPCTVRKNGSFDVYGQPVVGASYAEKCGALRLQGNTVQTPIHGSGTATQGNADESTVDAILLLAADTRAELDDTIIVAGMNVRVTGKYPRHDRRGKLHHYEIQGKAVR